MASKGEKGGKSAIDPASGIFTDKEPVYIEADEVILDREHNILRARGKVAIRQKEVLMRADEVELNTETLRGRAKGDVRLTKEGELVEADELYFDLKGGTGLLVNGYVFIKDGNFHIIGREISKGGEREYSAKNVVFTTCNGRPPDWSFEGSRLDLEIEGYATATDVKFRVRDLPIAYIPWMIYPVKIKRQSGFLLPRVLYSSEDGLRFDLPFFWAFSRHADATLTTSVLAKRGELLSGQLRYAATVDDYGEWGAQYIRDVTAETEDEDYGLFLRENRERYRIAGKHLHHKRPWSRFWGGIYVDRVSDRDYLDDFGEPGEWIPPYLRTGLYANYKLRQFVLGSSVEAYQDMTKLDDRETFSQLPEVRLSVLRTALGKYLRTQFDSTFTRWQREEGTEGNKIVAQPVLCLIMNRPSWFPVFVEAGSDVIGEWVEGIEKEDTEPIIYPYLKSEGKLRLERVYKGAAGRKREVSHRIEPSISYFRSYDVDAGEEMLPSEILPPSRRGIYQRLFQFSKSYIEQNCIWASVNNSLTFREGNDEKFRLSLKLTQGYSFFESPVRLSGEEDGGWSPLLLDGRVGFGSLSTASWRTTWLHQLHTFSEYNLRVSLKDRRGDSLICKYRRSSTMQNSELVKSEQIGLEWDMVIKQGFSIDVRSDYSITDETFLENAVSIMYKPQCWSVNIDLSDIYDPDTEGREKRVMFVVSLYGLGQVGRALFGPFE